MPFIPIQTTTPVIDIVPEEPDIWYEDRPTSGFYWDDGISVGVGTGGSGGIAGGAVATFTEDGVILDTTFSRRMEENGSFESDINGWDPIGMFIWMWDDAGDLTQSWVSTNSVLSRNEDEGILANSLQINVTTFPTDYGATSPIGTSGREVVPDTTYQVLFGVKTPINEDPAVVTPQISWYTAGGAYISTSYGDPVTVDNTIFVNIQLTATAPGTAEFAAIGVMSNPVDGNSSLLIGMTAFVGAGEISLSHNTNTTYTYDGSVGSMKADFPATVFAGGVFTPDGDLFDGLTGIPVLPGQYWQFSSRLYSTEDVTVVVMGSYFDTNGDFVGMGLDFDAVLPVVANEWNYISATFKLPDGVAYMKIGTGCVSFAAVLTLYVDEFKARRSSSVTAGYISTNDEGSAVHLHSGSRHATAEFHIVGESESEDTPGSVAATNETFKITAPSKAGAGNVYAPVITMTAGTDATTAIVDINSAVTVESLDVAGAFETSSTLTAERIRIPYSDFFGNYDAGLASTGHHLQLGETAATNLILDQDEIMARNNGAASPLYINADGGSVSIGSATTSAVLNLGTNTTTAAGGLIFGDDTTLYRSAADTLKTDDSLVVAINLRLGAAVATATTGLNLIGGTTAADGIAFGTDTNLYRSAADTLKTDDALVVGVNLRLGAAVATAATGLNLVSGTAATAGIAFGTDTNLYRSAADTLKTDDKLHVVGELELDGALNHDGTTIGVYNSTPVAQSTDWNVVGTLTERKTLDLTSVSLTQLAEYVATLTKKLRKYDGIGFLGAGYVPPDIGYSWFYTAETMTGAGAAAVDWVPVKGTATLTKAGTPTVQTDASFGGKNYVKWSGTSDRFHTASLSMTQDFVIVMYARVSGATTNSVAKIFDSYTNGSAPANRCTADYQNTTVDQQRMYALTTTLTANWASDYTTKLWELCYAGASSYWKRDGVSTLSGNPGTSSMAGLVLGALYDLGTTQGNDKLEICYIGAISKTLWDAGRAQHVLWHNDRYTEDAV